MTSSYLVTGSAGFIGARVVELLLEEGAAVTGVDNLNDAYDVRLKQWRLSRLDTRSGFKFCQLDICDREALRGVFGASFDAVINLAARAGVPQSLGNPWAYIDTNVTGTLNLLEMCRDFGVPKFVQASTSSIYGASDKRPYEEHSPTGRPLSPYAASKMAAESLCFTYHHLYQLDVTVLRFFTVYGPAGRPDMSLFRFVQWIAEGRPVTVYGDGRQSRDFTYVDDIARGAVAATKPLGYEVVNLGSGSPVKLMDAIKMLEMLLDKTANIVHEPSQPGDVPATWADIGKAQRLLGWRPQTDIEIGTGRLVEWYLENRSWAREIAA